jgi:hypothetical protein
MTRRDYLEGRVTHQEYYESVADAAGIAFSSPMSREFMGRVTEALSKGDKHLNSIPLREWDWRAAAAKRPISRALREHGDSWSAAGAACTMKAAAIRDAKSREVA